MEVYIGDDDDGDIDLFHPNGRCTCFGEGKCDWCKKIDKESEADVVELVDTRDLGSRA